jgi:hypothetical protein
MQPHFDALCVPCCSPGQPKGLKGMKWYLVYPLPQSQHHSYVQIGQLKWLQPSSLWISILHFGHVLTSFPSLHFFSSTSKTYWNWETHSFLFSIRVSIYFIASQTLMILLVAFAANFLIAFETHCWGLIRSSKRYNWRTSRVGAPSFARILGDLVV